MNLTLPQFSDCEKFFRSSQQQITTDDSVICDTTFSKVVPLEHGEVSFYKKR